MTADGDMHAEKGAHMHVICRCSCRHVPVEVAASRIMSCRSMLRQPCACRAAAKFRFRTCSVQSAPSITWWVTRAWPGLEVYLCAAPVS